MKEKKLFKINAWDTLFIVVMALAVFMLNVKYIFVDFGIDAEFQLTMSYRLAMGEKMFSELLEPYQMSAILGAAFAKLYLNIFHTTTGIVLYFQMVGVMLDLLVAIVTYRFIKKEFDKGYVAIAAFFALMIISVKDVPSPEYANMQVWFSVLFTIAMYKYLSNKKVGYAILAAVFVCGAILSYPSCILLYLVAIVILIRHKDLRGVCVFTGICIGLGLLFIAVTVLPVGVKEFVDNIRIMLSLETSHSQSGLQKISDYFLQAGKIAGIVLLNYCVAFAVSKIYSFISNRKAGDCEENKASMVNTTCDIKTFNNEMIVRNLTMTIVSVFLGLITVIRYKDFVRYSYSYVFLVIILVGWNFRKGLDAKEKLLYHIGLSVSFTEFAATALLTNLELISVVPFLLLGVVVSFIPIYNAVCKRENLKRLAIFAVLSVAFLLVFRNVYIIRPLWKQQFSLFEIGSVVKKGPALGIFSEYMGPYMQNVSYDEWEQNIIDGENIFIVGGDSLDMLGYLYKNTGISAPSTVPTPGYTQALLEYWDKHPEKYPDVIIASCWYGNLNSVLAENTFFMDWIENKFEPDKIVDGCYWRYYIKRR